MSGLGGAVSSIFSGIGSFEEAGAYDEAAGLAKKNAAIVKLSTGIQEEQATRQGYQVIGATEAAAGANNLVMSGSALDILKSNTQQISLNKQLIENQGQIEETGWLEKASADEGMASAAQMEGIGKIAGGALGLALTVICTELRRQGKIPKRWYLEGAKVSIHYPAAVMEGYHLWAVPSVRHLRAHPDSLYSSFLETIFYWYLENIAAAANVPGARKHWRGTAVTFLVWRLCYLVGLVRISLNRLTDWEGLYRA